MHIETLCTGDELLTGLTSDTNSAHFQRLLLERLGEQVCRGVVVGDVRADLIAALDAGAARADVLLVSGGLGPTADDLTAECAATAAGVGLVQSAAALAHLEERFRQRGVTLTDNNFRQALVPAGAEVVLNPEGSAPCFIQTRGRCTLFFVPGVPHEYRHLVEQVVLPRLEGLLPPGRPVRALKVLKTVGLPESHLDARVRPLFAQHPRVTFGFRTHAPENHLKLLAEAPTRAEAEAALAHADAASAALLGEHLFGRDDQTLPGVVHAELRRRHQTVGVAESCTGGLVSALLSEPGGASDVFRGGLVPYLESNKTRWAGVPKELLLAHGAVSAPVAKALAEGARHAAEATWGVAVTGYAGPTGGDPHNPVGTIFLAVSGPGVVRAERHVIHGERARVRAFAAHLAVDLLRRALASG